MRFLTILTLPFLLLASESRSLAANNMAQGEPETLIGEQFRDLKEADPKGKLHQLSEYAGKGKWVLIDFWASWCGPCQWEMPNVVEAYKKYHDKGLEIVGLSFDSDKDAWENAIKYWDMPWIHLSDLKGGSSLAGRVYGITGIPDNVLIDPEGTIVARDLRGPRLEAVLSNIFDSSTDTQPAIARMAAWIRECDIALNDLRATIDAHETNAEDRFAARQAHAGFTRERKRWVKKLEKHIDSITE